MIALDLWGRLGADMRAVRLAAGLSLRQAEAESGWGRGTLSQVENGKARPSRALVEWYEGRFAADGLLLSIFAEARGAHRADARLGTDPLVSDGDDFIADNPLVPNGHLVRTGDKTEVGWTLRNAGTVPWFDRRLQRVGAYAAAQLITSGPSAPIEDCAPGEAVDVRLCVVAPDRAGTLAAYWTLADEKGRPCFAPERAIPLVLVVR